MAKKNHLTTSNYLPYEEFKRFLNCLRQDKEYRWEMYARLSFCTACRASDVLKFRWKDVLGVTHCMVTEKKTGKTREILINPSVQRNFNTLWKALGCPDKNDFILPSSRKGEHLTIQYVNYMLKIFKQRYDINIDHFSTHTFRKTFGRYVYEKSGRSAESLVLLNTIFKHGNIETTKVYIGLRRDEIDNVFAGIKL